MPVAEAERTVSQTACHEPALFAAFCQLQSHFCLTAGSFPGTWMDRALPLPEEDIAGKDCLKNSH